MPTPCSSSGALGGDSIAEVEEMGRHELSHVHAGFVHLRTEIRSLETKLPQSRLTRPHKGVISVTAQSTTSRLPKLFLAIVAIVTMLTIIGCSSDATSEADGKGAKPAAADSTSKLPDGFPDIPLPDFVKFDVVKKGTESAPGWSVMFTVDAKLQTSKDEIVTAYIDQLKAAGYTIDGDATDVNVNAKKADHEIFFHSSMDGTITIGVI